MTTPLLMKNGTIEVITGCMFSGKSEEAGKRITKELLAKNRHVLIFTPKEARREIKTITGEIVDTSCRLVSRGFSRSYDAIEFPKDSPREILNHVQQLIQEQKPLTTVVIEEAHFCSNELVEVCEILANQYQLRVIVVGLDLTFDNKPFTTVTTLMAVAEFIKKELAVCDECGSHGACKSWLDSREISKAKGNILVGNTQYKALCRHCYEDYRKKYL